MLRQFGHAEAEEESVSDVLSDFESGPYAPPTTSECEAPSTPRRRGMSVWTLMQLVAVFAFAFGLLAALGRAVGSAREAARRSQCTCNYCGILLALHNYHSTFGAFPPAYVADASGKPMHSWRVLILPYIEQTPLYNRYNFNEPWDGPSNSTLLNAMPPILACPSRFSSPTHLTSYVAVRGPGTMFPGSHSTKIDDITDRTFNTLAIVEVDNVDVPWTSPWDLDVRTMSFQINDPKRIGISSKHPGGANVGVADGKSRFARDSVTPGNLSAALTIAGGEGITMDQALGEK